jgi:DNA-binding MarR family transcriptional regulator
MSAPFALVFGGGAFRDMTLPKAPLDELYRRPGFMIRRAHQISVSLFLEETGELGITNRQYGILLVLKQHPGIDQITVAKLLGLDRSTTGMVLTKLEQAGLVGRVVGAKDRRKRSLALTPAGERMLKRLAEPARRAQQRVLSAFTPQEAKTFLDLLDKFARAFNETTRVPQVAQHADKKGVSTSSFRGATQRRTRNP